MRQIEVSRTMVFDAAAQRPGVLRGAGRRQPRPGPARADRVDLRQEDPAVDARRLRYPGRHPRRRCHASTSATNTPAPSSTSKKAGRCGSRPWSTTRPISGCCAGWSICPNFKRKARDVNRRLLDHEHVGQGCVLASPAFERIARPSLVDGRRAPALRFGDPRVQALAGALAITAHLIGGFTNRSLRPLVAGLLGEPYSQARCCYDLRRLRLKGLIVRLRAFQHLRPHRRRATLRRLLHQGPQPAAATADGRRPATRTAAKSGKR